MKSRKQVKMEGFGGLTGPIVELKPLKHHPELVELDGEIQELRAQRTGLEEQLGRAIDRPIPPAEKVDTVADALAIKSGVAVKTLTVERVETSRESLRRQIAAVEKRLLDAGEEHRILWAKLIQEICQEIKPEVEAFAAEYVSCLEDLQACLQKNEKLWQLLSRNGLQTGYRPAHWTLTPYDSFLLHSGNGFATLAYYIESRKKAWKIGGAA